MPIEPIGRAKDTLPHLSRLVRNSRELGQVEGLDEHFKKQEKDRAQEQEHDTTAAAISNTYQLQANRSSALPAAQA